MKLFNLLTVYPAFFESFKSHGLIKKGLDKAYGTIANVKGENTESMVTHGDRKSMPSENDRG